MKTKVLIVAVLALALCAVGFAPAVHAAEKAGGAKAAAKAPAGVKAEVTGKTETKTEKVKDKAGKEKEVKVATITVTEAKGADGKAIADLAGKTLTAKGGKGLAELEALSGKEVVAKGTVIGGKTIVVDSATEKK